MVAGVAATVFDRQGMAWRASRGVCAGGAAAASPSPHSGRVACRKQAGGSGKSAADAKTLRGGGSVRASASRNKRANAGLIFDNVTKDFAEESIVFFEDKEGREQQQQQHQTVWEGSASLELERESFGLETFDFEAEKSKLLLEKKQLEVILERLEEHGRSLKVDASSSGSSSEGKAASKPARMRRDRYRTSLQRQQDSSRKVAAEAKATGEAGGVGSAAAAAGEGAPAKAKGRKANGKRRGASAKAKGLSTPPSQLAARKGGAGKSGGVFGGAQAHEFVSTTSEESLSVASTSSSNDAVTTLLQERRHLNLLSREEEARLIEQAQFCFKVENAIQELDRSMGSPPSYEQLCQAMGKGGQKEKPAVSAAKLRQRHLEAMEARRFMLDHNVRLVVHLAHRYKGKGVSLGDLVQEGIQGLLTAIEKFDLSRNLKFSTYATWWIKQSLIRGICNYSRDVRLPVHITDTYQKMNKIQREAGNGKIKYSVEELADLMGCKPNKLQNVLESTRSAISLEVLCGANSSANSSANSELKALDILSSSGGGGGGSGGNIEDALTVAQSDEVGENIDSELYEKLLQDDVDAVLKMLPPRERNILRMRFGLTPIDDMCLSLVDIGAAYGLTRERVRQMEARALNKLRQPKVSTKLQKYVKNDEEGEEDTPEGP